MWELSDRCGTRATVGLLTPMLLPLHSFIVLQRALLCGPCHRARRESEAGIVMTRNSGRDCVSYTASASRSKKSN